MAKDVILLGEVPARGTTMSDIHLLAEWGADASIRDIMREQIDSCSHRDDTQLYIRCDPYPDLVWLFDIPPGLIGALFR